MAGILLGGGNSRDKAALLSDHWDTEITKVISKETFKNILDVLFDVAVKHIPKVWVKSESKKMLPREAIEAHLGKIRGLKVSFMVVVAEMVFGD